MRSLEPMRRGATGLYRVVIGFVVAPSLIIGQLALAISVIKFMYLGGVSNWYVIPLAMIWGAGVVVFAIYNILGVKALILRNGKRDRTGTGDRSGTGPIK